MLSGGLGALSAVPPSVLKALGIEPEEGSSFMDAEHVVILMQENRSFDHAFGTLRGVRGFEDPRAVHQPGGNPVWLQTDHQGDTYASFRVDIHESKATWMGCLPHDRGSQVEAGNHGKHDLWLKVKQSHRKEYEAMPLTLGYYDREDLPFYHAFADAFTICDQHFCSVQTCTTPNRLFLWTGTNRDPRDRTAAPLLDNSEIDHDSHADWMTFPERLEDHGIPWKIYQNEIDLATGFHGEEDSWLGNFGDNPMEFFSQYHVKFSASHLAHLQRRIDALSKQLGSQLTERLADGLTDQLTGQLLESVEAPGLEKPNEPTEREEKQRQEDLKILEKLQKELDDHSPEAFARLPLREQNLHRRAFTTNTGDPLQRKLTTLNYREGETERKLTVPAGDVLHQFRKDVDSGNLPTVSWLIAPENFSDHPSAPWYGAWYVSEVLDILTRDPEVWKKTIFILTYDENDGYYDHVPPFTPPHPGLAGSGAASKGVDTELEFDPLGHPIGLGYRVPMVIASPWSRGGNVCSQVFDHTSVLRFLEVFLAGKTATPLVESNISAWRRTICGDLTSAFGGLAEAKGGNPTAVERDVFVEQIHRARFGETPGGYRKLTEQDIQRVRENPGASPALPQQEAGTRPSRALPYELHAEGRLNRDAGMFTIAFDAAKAFGEKSAGAPFQVYAPGGYRSDGGTPDPDGPTSYEQARRWAYAVAAGERIEYAWPVDAFEDSVYHLRAYGPNGFHREYRGNLADPPLEIASSYGTGNGRPFLLKLSNTDLARELEVTVNDLAYGGEPVKKNVRPGDVLILPFDLSASGRWYDLEVVVAGYAEYSRRYAGRVENGEQSTSDPQIGRRAAAIARDAQTAPPTGEI